MINTLQLYMLIRSVVLYNYSANGEVQSSYPFHFTDFKLEHFECTLHEHKLPRKQLHVVFKSTVNPLHFELDVDLHMQIFICPGHCLIG